MRKHTLYLAGPEVFLPNALEIAETQRNICKDFGFIPRHPFDNDAGSQPTTARSIYRGNINQIRGSDIIVANCNPFRGMCIDDGTAYELGFGNALGKPTYGYIWKIERGSARIARNYPGSIDARGVYTDREGFLVEDLGTSVNLIMECGMYHLNGRLIQGDFETCVAAVRSDINTGRLVL